jgi:hypothetical protein
MKKIIFILLVVAFSVSLGANDLFLVKFPRGYSAVFGWDHMEKGWLTEMVTNFSGDFLNFGAGPMFDVGPISFNSPILISLEERGIAEEITICPRMDIEKGNLLFQSWHSILASFNNKEVAWQSDTRLWIGKLGLNFLCEEFSFSSIGLIGQMPVNETLSLEAFFGGKPGETISPWLKIKAFF